MKIGLVCKGNIFRSQVFEHFLRSKIKDKNLEIFSCGVLPKVAFPEEKILLNEVKEELVKRGINVYPIRTPWSNETREMLKKADLILTATLEIKNFIIKNTKNKNIKTFYEFIGEEEKDFEDPFNYQIRKQDPKKFKRGFIEIERLAELTANKLK